MLLFIFFLLKPQQPSDKLLVFLLQGLCLGGLCRQLMLQVPIIGLRLFYLSRQGRIFLCLTMVLYLRHRRRHFGFQLFLVILRLRHLDIQFQVFVLPRIGLLLQLFFQPRPFLFKAF